MPFVRCTVVARFLLSARTFEGFGDWGIRGWRNRGPASRHCVTDEHLAVPDVGSMGKLGCLKDRRQLASRFINGSNRNRVRSVSMESNAPASNSDFI